MFPTTKIVLRNKYPVLFEDTRKHLEISLDGLTILEELTTRLEAYGGTALVIDYGHDGSKEDTFRGFYRHQLHDPLINPGTADLTADVDFSMIKKLFEHNTMICGPVAQREFLTQLGIEYRLKVRAMAMEL
jgi:NADH dehydrogenase [ubiquinone] 1 alpha subcomplex assembly factor 7